MGGVVDVVWRSAVVTVSGLGGMTSSFLSEKVTVPLDRNISCLENPWCFVAPKILVSRSARFRAVAIYQKVMICAATASLIRWNATELCFFLSVDDGSDTFNTTLLLSPRIIVGPAIGTPIILITYLISIAVSVATFPATSSAPCVDDSTVGWRLLIQRIGVELRKTIIPVLERLVTLSAAWSASTYMISCPLVPFGSNILSGTSSFASG